MSRNVEPPFVGDRDKAVRRLRAMTRRSFTVGGLAAVAGGAGLGWLHLAQLEDGVPWPLRRALSFNERLARGLFGPTRLAPEFPLARSSMPRANGLYGLDAQIEPAKWNLTVTSEAAGSRPFSLTLDDVRRLQRVELTTELKCIEGWSQIVHWTGARLYDFADHYRLAARNGRALEGAAASDLLDYVALETPDGEYYVGLDMPSALHPQTLLCYEMNGRPLEPQHGAPLRLVIPVKYGIKHLKRIGRIAFTDSRPRDYWAERGYDWYAGH
jgi:DMSO/TMAO reductase YedYZ molybdopterin-dependent catalytic subunit